VTENINSVLKRIGFTGVKMTIEKVCIDDIKEDVQRIEGIDDRKVNRMAEAFNPYGLGTITISRRPNGDMFVLDGRHRVAAARSVDYKSLIPAVVLTGLSRDQEHELFIILNTRTAVSAISQFVNSVGALRPDHVVMNQVIEDHGWKVGRHAPRCVDRQVEGPARSSGRHDRCGDGEDARRPLQQASPHEPAARMGVGPMNAALLSFGALSAVSSVCLVPGSRVSYTTQTGEPQEATP
jgi:hypothetical protein